MTQPGGWISRRDAAERHAPTFANPCTGTSLRQALARSLATDGKPASQCERLRRLSIEAANEVSVWRRWTKRLKPAMPSIVPEPFARCIPERATDGKPTLAHDPCEGLPGHFRELHVIDRRRITTGAANAVSVWRRWTSPFRTSNIARSCRSFCNVAFDRLFDVKPSSAAMIAAFV